MSRSQRDLQPVKALGLRHSAADSQCRMPEAGLQIPDSRFQTPPPRYPLPDAAYLLFLLSLLLATAAADGIDTHIQAIKKALDPEAAIDLEETLDAIEGIKEAKPGAGRQEEAVGVLVKLLEREKALTLSAGQSRVPPLMLLKSEAARALHHLKAAQALPALQAFQARERNTRYFPEEAVEQAIEDLSLLAEGEKASKPGPDQPSGAWRERWKKTDEGRRFLELADRMAQGSHGEAAGARDQLMRSGNPVVPFLTDCLLHHEHEDGRRSSAYLLGQIDDPWTVPDLIKALDEKNDNVLWTVITSLGSMEDKRATERILPFLDHSLDRIRVAAAQALIRLRDPRSVEPLMAHLQKYKTGQSLSRAAEALGEIGDRRAMPLLLEKMTCPYVVLREYAAMAYGKLANDKDLEGLLALASQGKMDIREAQLAFEEQFQSDFKIDTKLPVQQLVESVRQQYQKLKEEPATTRTPEKTRLEREIEDKAEDQ